MTKNFKLVLALILSIMMILSMVPAMANGETYSITISDQNNVTVAGQTFTAYKLFDVSYTGANNTDPHAYTLSTSSPFYDATLVTGTPAEGSLAELLKTYFTFTANTSDSTKVNVVPVDSFNETAARTFADALKAKIPSSIGDAYKTSKTAEASATSVTLNPTTPGYYIVVGTAKPVNDYDATLNPTVTAAVALTTTDPDATINVKADAPALSKKITSSDGNTTTTAADDKDGRILDEKGQAAVAAVGKVVSFELDSKVPDMTGYSKYLYKINDTMTSGLDYVNESMILAVGSNNNVTILTVTGETTDEQKAAAAAYIEWSNNNRTFALTINKATLDTAGKDANIVLTYNAKVNDSALSTNYEKNTANLEYSNNPYDDSSKNKTPDDIVYVIDINIDVYKYAADKSDTKAKTTYADDAAAKTAGYVKYEGTDKSDEKYWVKATALNGAKFVLYKGATQPVDTAAAWYKYDTTKNEATWVTRANADVFESTASGNFNPQVRGLAEGSYGLLETEAPTGYNLLTAPVTVTITAAHTADATQATYTASAGVLTGGTIDLSQTPAAQPVDTLQVLNQAGAELPSTGGIGTTIFYVAGSILVLAAAILLITKRRMGAGE